MASSTNKDTFQITRYGVMIFVVILFGVFIRTFLLDSMAFHHDESLHAYYSHKVYTGDLQAYKYDPTYHGPFLYHYGALFFVLFGDNDFVARLPFVSFGLLMLYFVWRLKPFIGKTGVLITLVFVSVSPTLVYFSRFARNDIYISTMALGIVAFGLDYLRTRQGKYLIWMTFFLTLMYTCKENSYMYGFLLGSFIVFYGVYYYFSYSSETRSRALYEIFNERAPFVKILALYGIFSCTFFSLVFWVTHSGVFKTTAVQFKTSMGEESFSIGVLRRAWDQYMQAHSSLTETWLATGITLAVSVCLLVGWIGWKVSSKQSDESLFSRIARNNVLVIACLFVAVALYAILFTTMGTNTGGMKSGAIDYVLYWMGQQGAPRIAGPPDYYIPRLLIYETGGVIFAAIAFCFYLYRSFGTIHFAAFMLAFLASVNAYWHVILRKDESGYTSILFFMVFLCISAAIVFSKKAISLFSFVPQEEKEEESKSDEDKSQGISPDGFRIFLLYWTVGSVLIYAALHEKVPWLLVHQVLPLLLLTGVFIGDLWNHLPSGWLKTSFAIIVGFLVVYEARTAMQLNFFRPDDPRELIIYTQSDHSVVDRVREIAEGADRLGPLYMPPNPKKAIAAVKGTAEWPYFWYLRNYKLGYVSNNGVPPPDIPFAIMDEGLESNMKVWAKGKYTKRRIKHRVWWPPPAADKVKTLSMNHELPFSYMRGKNRKASDAWMALWRYLLYREIWDVNDASIEPPAAYVLFYRREPLLEPEEPIQVAEGYQTAPIPFQVIAQAGKFGNGVGVDGQNVAYFNEPRGVALSPDESSLYVLDAGNGRIQVFDANLNFKGWFGGPGTGQGQFRTEAGANVTNGGIAVGTDGSIFATDTWGSSMGRINHYSPDGKPLPPMLPPDGKPFYYPRGLDTDNQGKVYVTDTGNNRVLRFLENGTYDGELVSGGMQEPVGITVGPNNLIYVCDVGMKRVVAYRAQGGIYRQWSIFGWNPDAAGLIIWIEPYIAVDNNGFVYITDSSTNTVQRLDPIGKNVVQAGGAGRFPGNLRGPKGITVDSQGNLYIADSFNHRIIKTRFPQ